MKLIVFVIWIAMATPAVCQVKVSAEPFRGANMIVIKADSTKSTDELFTLLGRTLVKGGYTLDVSNREFYQFKVGKRVLPGLTSRAYHFSATIIDSDILIRIVCDLEHDEDVQWFYIESRITGSPAIHDDIVARLGALGRVGYSKEL